MSARAIPMIAARRSASWSGSSKSFTDPERRKNVVWTSAKVPAKASRVAGRCTVWRMP
jgi:hypothetical protein